jgi:hypothetical protein
MEDLKESSDVLLILFFGNLFQSVIVLGKKDSFLCSVLQDGIWKRLVWECRVCFFFFFDPLAIGSVALVRMSISPKVR